MSVDRSFVDRRLAQLLQEKTLVRARFHGATDPDEVQEHREEFGVLAHCAAHLRRTPARTDVADEPNAGAQT